MNKNYLLGFALLVFGMSWLWQKPTQPHSAQVVQTLKLVAGDSIGQTFVSNYHGLNQFSIQLNPIAEQPADGEIRLWIYSDTRLTGEPLASARLPASAVSSHQPAQFQLSKTLPSQSTYFYARIESDFPLEIPLQAGQAYLEGAAYFNDLPLDAQTFFDPDYAKLQLGVGLVQELAKWLGFVFAVSFFFIVPGVVLFSAITDLSKWHWLAILPFSFGFGFASQVVLYLFFYSVGIQLGRWYVFVWVFANLAFLIYIIWRKSWEIRPRTVIKSLEWADILGMSVLGLLVIQRWWEIRTLQFPMWHDSVHHTLITQLVLENGGLFSSWAPYLALKTFSYHFGLHINTANVAWLTGFSAHFALLWFCQLLNIMAIWSVGGLAFAFTKNRWSIMIPILLAGFVLYTPNLYTNWGRYTQLAAQVVYPALIGYIYWQWQEQKFTFGGWIVAGITLAALGLTHYRVLTVYPFFLLSVFFVAPPRYPISRKMLKNSPYVWLGLHLLIAGLILLPWLLSHLESTIFGMFVKRMTVSPIMGSTSPVAWQELLWNSITSYWGFGHLPLLVFLFAIFSFGLAWQKELHKPALLTTLWWVSLVMVSQLANIDKLPGKGIVDGFTTWLQLYVPISLLCALGFLQIFRSSQQKFLAGSLLLLFPLLLFRQRTADIFPARHQMVTTPDLHAVQWMQNNLPATAKIMTAGEEEFKNMVTGTDAGVWLAYLAQLNTTSLPMIYTTEKPTQVGYFQELVDFHQQSIALTKQNDTVGFAQLLEGYQVDYVFVGQQQGQTHKPKLIGTDNSLPPNPDGISPAFLQSVPNLQVIYHQDRVWMFENKH